MVPEFYSVMEEPPYSNVFYYRMPQSKKMLGPSLKVVPGGKANGSTLSVPCKGSCFRRALGSRRVAPLLLEPVQRWTAELINIRE